MNDMQEIRKRIDAADDEILAALNRRFALAAEMRAYKKAHDLPRVDAVREKAILERVAASVPPADRDTACAVYERILGGSRGEIETIARGICVMDGKVLLCRAKGGATTYLPGGHIEFGETGAEALVRELKEETGLTGTAGELLGVVENSFLQHGRRHCEINLVYRLKLQGVAEGVPPAVAAQEDWITFEWCDIAALDTAKLMPSEMQALVAKSLD